MALGWGLNPESDGDVSTDSRTIPLFLFESLRQNLTWIETLLQERMKTNLLVSLD
jgi:hypothetical protein